ncbi:MAG: DUF3467 domain-containing protein [Bacteroidetes bacterium]|nr:DUF3467 domain-containing protein [Bacteroidota bacterium]
MAEDKNALNQLNIELAEDIAEGHYSNLAIISHSNAEFILDFIRILPGVPKAKVKSRIIMTPQHAKRLMLAISDNISKFENQFGEIEINDNDPHMPPLNFGGPAGVA